MTDSTPGPATLVDRPMAELVDDLLTAVGWPSRPPPCAR